MDKQGSAPSTRISSKFQQHFKLQNNNWGWTDMVSNPPSEEHDNKLLWFNPKKTLQV